VFFTNKFFYKGEVRLFVKNTNSGISSILNRQCEIKNHQNNNSILTKHNIILFCGISYLQKHNWKFSKAILKFTKAILKFIKAILKFIKAILKFTKAILF